MDLHLTSLGNLVPEAPCYVFYAIRRYADAMFDTDGMDFGTLIWYLTHKQIHTRTHRDQ